MRVLIVEDDGRVAAVLKEGLEEIGIGADLVTDGRSAVTAATSSAYDAVILDVMLSSTPDGFEVCRQLRGEDVPSAVLMLTALDAVPDRVHGWNAGADDYLVKPFAFSELVARLRAVTRRRVQGDGTPVLEVRGLRLDRRTRRVTVDGEEIVLTRKEFDILELLLSNVDHVLSKERIQEHIWNDDPGLGSNLVEVYMARLRRKLGERCSDPYITTVRNVGYRFERRAAARFAASVA